MGAPLTEGRVSVPESEVPTAPQALKSRDNLPVALVVAKSFLGWHASMLGSVALVVVLSFVMSPAVRRR